MNRTLARLGLATLLGAAVVALCFKLDQGAGYSALLMYLLIASSRLVVWRRGRLRKPTLTDAPAHPDLKQEDWSLDLRVPRELRVVEAIIGIFTALIPALGAIVALASGEYFLMTAGLLCVALLAALFGIVPWRQRLMVSNGRIRFRNVLTSEVSSAAVDRVRINRGLLGTNGLELVGKGGQVLMRLPAFWAGEDVMRALSELPHSKT